MSQTNHPIRHFIHKTTVNQLWIMDVSIITGYQMSETWDIMVSKYKQPDIIDIQCWAPLRIGATSSHNHLKSGIVL